MNPANMMQRLASPLSRDSNSLRLLTRFRQYATVDSDSHDDFKAKTTGAAPTGDASSIIEEDIKKHDVFIFMKGIPAAPQCGFSNMACQILTAYGVKFGSRNVLEDQAIREGIKKFSNWPTIPQIYVNGEFVGGSDILMNMHNSGELEKLFGPIIKAQQGK